MNVVEIHIKANDGEARVALKAFEDEAKSSGEKAGKSFSDRFKSIMGNGLGNSLKGGGLFAGLSSGLAASGPLAAAGLAIGAFSAVAVPELTKVQTAMSATGKAGQTAMAQLSGPEKQLVPALQQMHTAFDGVKAALAPVVDKTIALGAHLVTDLMPALKTMASAGGKVIDGFLKPLDALIRSSTFDKFIKVMAQGAAQIAPLLGGVFTQLLRLLMQLFIQLMPAGLQILQALLPAIVQLLQSLTPIVVVVAKVVAGIISFLAANHLLLPVLGVLALAFLALASSTGIGAVVIAVTVLVAAIDYLVHHWSQVWAGIKHVVADAVDFIKAHWQLILAILMGPVGVATLFIIDHFHQIVGVAGSVMSAIGHAFSAAYHFIVDPIASAYHAVIGFFDDIIHYAESIPGKVMGILGSLGSKALGLIGLEHGGTVGAAATGGIRSNLTMVGEHGRELVNLPAGSQVHSNPDTERMMAGGSGGGEVTVVFDFGGQASDELVKWLRKSIRVRGGNVQTVLGH